MTIASRANVHGVYARNSGMIHCIDNKKQSKPVHDVAVANNKLHILIASYIEVTNT